MTILTVRDFLRSIARSLQISTSFPAAILVLVNAYFVIPRFAPFDLTGIEATTLIISAILIVSYLLQALNYPIIRVLEGYRFREGAPLVHMQEREKSRYQLTLDQLEILDAKLVNISEELPVDFDPTKKYSKAETSIWTEPQRTAYRRWQSASYKYAYLQAWQEANYPSAEDAILPTPLGNVIAAFEEYPFSRYGIDSIALWPRLLPILKRSNYMDFVVQEKSVFDFLMYMMTVSFFLGLELAYLQAYWGSLGWFIGIIVLTILAIVILYNALVVSARQWGVTVKVAFDLHRWGLFESLHLQSVESMDEEKQRWREVSSFLVQRKGQYPAEFLQPVTSTTSDNRENKI